ncbi:SAG family member [Eimeria mitis]|uniref:SAG family member n=1 Tax=Eimeria mitis TaxID=44415 RepID=U6K7E9_9EIME|nr:SAG family member [Eimeria mitis]CDJ33925.1 SAG family member [Eimeria mitis]
MSPLTLVAVISASFLAFATAKGAEPGTGPTYSVSLGGDGECLAAVNAARQAVGFSQLLQAGEGDTKKRLPGEVTSQKESEDGWAWKPVCESLIPTNEKLGDAAGSGEQAQFESGTYAYHVVDNPDAVDCTAIVNKWKGAYSNFDGLPPPNKTDEALYQKQENVSFVALYNPSENATADCRVVTCTKTTPATASFTATRNTGDKTETGSALICMTVPDVLPKEGGKAPFTEEQWGQIVTALEGSASAVVPGVVSLALGILGLSML